MKIVYDAQKRDKTLEERGLDFDDAEELFSGYHFTAVDDRRDYGEVRKISVGLIRDDVVVVVWTERDNGRRIISMRKADQNERGAYYQQLD